MDAKTKTKIVVTAQKIIFGQEGNYGSINANDNGAVSVGKVQWHAGRALALLKKICAAESKAASILGAVLHNEIITAAAGAWDARTVSAAEKAAISKLLSTDAGKRVQDAQAEADVGAYVDHGLKVGVEDPAALVYFADLENQGGGGASARVAAAAKKPVTLDTIHAAALADRVMGKYATRRKSVYNAAKTAVTGGTKMNKKPVSYLQTDSRWKNKPYRVKGENATIGGSGCGPTAAAMLIETITGKKFTPEDACNWSMAHGYKALGNGTYYGYFKPQFAEFGIDCDMLNWTKTYGKPDHANHKKVEEMLKQGYYFIALMLEGLWTSGGHFVVLWWQDDKMRILDPASTKEVRLNGDVRTFRSQCAYYWWVDARKFNGYGAAVKPPVASSGTPATGSAPSLGLKVGDIVDFTGTEHYYSANASKPATCKPGQAKVTQIYNGKHPYQLIHVKGGGSTVYGWVNEKDIQPPALTAIDKLAKLGVINSPDYWKQAVTGGKVKYLDILLTKAAAKISKAGTRSSTPEVAVAALVAAGVIDTPDYWLSNYGTFPSLGALLCALGGAVK